MGSLLYPCCSPGGKCGWPVSPPCTWPRTPSWPRPPACWWPGGWPAAPAPRPPPSAACPGSSPGTPSPSPPRPLAENWPGNTNIKQCLSISYENTKIVNNEMKLLECEYVTNPVSPINSSQHDQPCQEMNTFKYFQSFSLFGWKTSI